MRILLFAALIIILANNALAEEITFANQDYIPGETVQSWITMQGFDLAKLTFLDNNSNKILVGFLTEKAGEKNFVYFNVPNIAAGQYFLAFKDKRVINGVLQDYELKAPLTILNGNGVSIFPAIIHLDPTKDEFSIELHNSADISVTVSATSPSLKPVRNTITLMKQETKKLFVSYNKSDIEQELTLSYLNRSYTITAPALQKSAETPIEKELTTRETPSSIEFVGASNVEKQTSRYTSFSDQIAIENKGKDLHNLKFTLTGNLGEIVELQTIGADLLAEKSTFNQYVWVNKKKDAKAGTYEGDLAASTEEGYSDKIHMKFTFEELALIKENTTSPGNIFNKSKGVLNLSVLLNETKAEEPPEVGKNLAIASVLAIIVLIIATIAAFKLRKRNQRKELKEYAKSLKKR